MSKQTAFDKAFSQAVAFTEGFGDCISALQYKTEQEALDYFYDYENCKPEGWGYREAVTVEKNWVKWHGGIDPDDGTMHNGWWINPKYEGQKGAKPVWACHIDWHMFRNGHTFEQATDKDGNKKMYHECKTCGATS